MWDPDVDIIYQSLAQRYGYDHVTCYEKIGIVTVETEGHSFRVTLVHD